MKPTVAAMDQLREARGPVEPDERAELRDEVRIMAILLIAHELETIANALVTTLESIDSAISSLNNVNQLELNLEQRRT